MKAFGQEFYPHESVRALRLAEKLKTTDRRELSRQIAAQLPQGSLATRKRLAVKIIQRFLKATQRRLAPWHEQEFAHLVARARQTPAQVELLYYRVAQIDEIVGALARELFYPVCIERRPPAEYSLDEFAARNGNRFPDAAPLLTRTFLMEHARRCWSYQSGVSLDRALRVLASAGLIARERMTELPGHPAAFCLAAHDVAPATFVWALYDEFQQRNAPPVTLREIGNAAFVRTLLLSPAQVENALKNARRHQLLQVRGDEVRLLFNSPSTLVDALLAKAM